MSKRLESVEITFENLDYVLVPVEYFEGFYISGIRTTVERLALNVVLQRTIPDRVEIELSTRIDVALSDLSSDLSFTPEENLSLLKRIESRRDIAYLDLYYDDGSSDQFYLPWEDDQDECHNKLLTTQYIVVVYNIYYTHTKSFIWYIISNPNRKSNHRHTQFCIAGGLLLYIDMVDQRSCSVSGQVTEGFHIGGKLFLVLGVQIMSIGVGLVVQNEPLITYAVHHIHNAVPDVTAGFAAERHFAVNLVSTQQY